MPHPDDFDIFAGHAAQHLISRGYRVYEILMTGGEYGIVNRFKQTGDHLKGPFLRKVRYRENLRARDIYNRVSPILNSKKLQKPFVTSISMGYVDGYLPVSKASIADLLDLLQKLRPEIIIGADPVFSYDWHRDHMATAYLTYFAVKKLITDHHSYIPKRYYLYQSFSPNRAFPVQSWDIWRQANLQHESQMTPLTVHRMAAVIGFFRKIFGRNSYKYREILTKNREEFDNTAGKITSFRDRVFYSLLHGVQTNDSLYYPTPEELGLSRLPERLNSEN